MSFYEGSEYGEKHKYGKNKPTVTYKKGDIVSYMFKNKLYKDRKVRHADVESDMYDVEFGSSTSIWLCAAQLTKKP